MAHEELAEWRGCPVCGSEGILVAHGRVAPFIVELTDSKSDETALMECMACTCIFFARPFSDEELTGLYGAYRDTDYLRARRRWEPWYRHNVNDAFALESPELKARIDFMEDIIESSGRYSFGNSLDYGGDGGQFFPKQCTGQRTVIDVSNKHLAPGVNRVSNLAEISEAPDFILICHLLEHLNAPAELLSDIRAVLKEDGCIYVEVPQDLPKVRKNHSTASYHRYLEWTRKSRSITILIDFLSGVCRQFNRRLPRLGLIKQSEHINYFSRQALAELITNSGFEVLEVRVDHSAGAGNFRMGKLGILAVAA